LRLITPSPAPTSSGVVAGWRRRDVADHAVERATKRSVSHLMAGFLAVYFLVWLPITTPGVSGAQRSHAREASVARVKRRETLGRACGSASCCSRCCCSCSPCATTATRRSRRRATSGVAAALGALWRVLVGLLASAMVWRALLADLGTPLPLRPALHVFFLGQLGKYVPGSVFAVAAQMELGRDHGAPRSRVGTAGVLFLGVLVACGLLTASVVLPLTSPRALEQYRWVLLLLPVGLTALAPPVLTRLVGLLLRLLRRAPLERPLSARGVGAAVGWALVMWAAYGVHLWLLVRPQGDASTSTAGRELLLATGAYALAWTAGLLFVVAPAGAGVRELALVAALAPVLDGRRRWRWPSSAGCS
jgi:hypothetical protein